MATPIPAKAVLEFTPRPRTLPGFVGREQLRARGKLFTKTKYGRNLLRLGHEGRQPS